MFAMVMEVTFSPTRVQLPAYSARDRVQSRQEQH